MSGQDIHWQDSSPLIFRMQADGTNLVYLLLQLGHPAFLDDIPPLRDEEGEDSCE